MIIETKKTIVCFGDSNTRYYLGDTQQTGDIKKSYPFQLLEMYHDSDEWGVRVLNRGFPDMQAVTACQYVEENVISEGANICILSFGTNDVRKPDADLKRYLDSMELMIQRCVAEEICTMVLLIPWYEEAYAGKEAQDRIPVWNKALEELCGRLKMRTIDTVSPFAENPRAYYNEVETPMRHYSEAACQKIADTIYRILERGE